MTKREPERECVWLKEAEMNCNFDEWESSSSLTAT